MSGDRQPIWTFTDPADGQSMDVLDCDGVVVFRVFAPGAMTSRRAVEMSADDALDLLLSLAGWVAANRASGGR